MSIASTTEKEKEEPNLTNTNTATITTTATTTTVPRSTDDTIDLYVKETIAQFQQVENRKAEMILDLARKISVLPGVEKMLIARTIVGKFRRFGYKIQQAFVYKVLPQEFKNENLSRAASEANKLRSEHGWDGAQQTYFEVKKYNIDLVPSYSKKTMMRIIYFLHEENLTLKKQLEELRSPS